MFSTFLFSTRWIISPLRCVVCARKVLGTTRVLSQSPPPSHGEIQHHHKGANLNESKITLLITFIIRAHTILATVGKYVHHCHHNQSIESRILDMLWNGADSDLLPPAWAAATEARHWDTTCRDLFAHKHARGEQTNVCSTLSNIARRVSDLLYNLTFT